MWVHVWVTEWMREGESEWVSELCQWAYVCVSEWMNEWERERVNVCVSQSKRNRVWMPPLPSTHMYTVSQLPSYPSSPSSHNTKLIFLLFPTHCIYTLSLATLLALALTLLVGTDEGDHHCLLLPALKAIHRPHLNSRVFRCQQATHHLHLHIDGI